ncbi:hypothetical protein [Bifidobacterium canis]|uniref:hypothetical protein n=1 Tax=Bifidobacterium canis TaxID=2610880 RepID=UPI0018C269FC|nr:hypothetical protein [Bifidobacterium canis]
MSPTATIDRISFRVILCGNWSIEYASAGALFCALFDDLLDGVDVSCETVAVLVEELLLC